MEIATTEQNLLQDLTDEVANWVEIKGWNDDRTFGDEIALLHSEASEALEAYRKRGFERWYVNMHGETITLDPNDPPDYGHEEHIAAIEAGIKLDKDAYKPQGVASEFADELIRLLDDCGRHGINPLAEYRAKMEYNWTRAYRHGGQNL